jgi:hypothetical protein
MKNSMYTVRRCRSLENDPRYGPFHASETTEKTACGIPVDDRWWIESNKGEGVTCKKCLRELSANA